MSLVIEGTTWRDLETQTNAWFRPGKNLELQIGLPRDLSATELAIVQERLLDEGLKLLAPIEMGSSEKWDNTLRIKFRSPVPTEGFAVLPVAVLIILAVGTVAVAGILGWTIKDLVQDYAPFLILGGLVFGIAWVAWSGARR